MKNKNRKSWMQCSALSLMLSVTLLPCIARPVWGQNPRTNCAQCGCHTCCQKVCRLVHEDKKVAVTCWGIQCEDICLGGPSIPGCEHCETVCGNCSAADVPESSKKEDTKKDEKKKESPADAKKDAKKELPVFSKAKRFLWTSWQPSGCGDVYTRKKLMKKTVTKTVPSYKWVVEEVCPDCLAKREPATVSPDAGIPPPPKVDGAMILVK